MSVARQSNLIGEMFGIDKGRKRCSPAHRMGAEILNIYVSLAEDARHVGRVSIQEKRRTSDLEGKSVRDGRYMTGVRHAVLLERSVYRVARTLRLRAGRFTAVAAVFTVQTRIGEPLRGG